LNKYFGASAVILLLFLLIAALVSPKVGFINASNNSPISKADSTAFLDVNNSHSHLFNKLMIWSTKYGRDVFWPIVIILLFVLGGWTGKKTAVVIAISMLVLIPLGELARHCCKTQTSSPKGRLLDSSRQRLWLSFWSCGHSVSWCRCHSLTI